MTCKARPLHVLILGSLALACMAPLAAGSDGKIEFEAPAIVAGSAMENTGPTILAQYAIHPLDAPFMGVVASVSTIELVNHTSNFISVAGTKVQAPNSPATQRTTIRVDANQLLIASLGPNATIILEFEKAAKTSLESSRLTAAATGTALVSGPGAPHCQTLEPFEHKASHWPNVATQFLDAPHWIVQSPWLSGDHYGKFRIYVNGATIQLTGSGGPAAIHTGTQTEETVAGPAEVSSWRRTTTAAIIQGTGHVNWTFLGPHAFALGSTVHLTNATSLSIPTASLEIANDGEPSRIGNRSLLDIRGFFNVTGKPFADEMPKELHLDIQGHIETIDTNRAQHTTVAPREAISAVIFGAVLLAILYAAKDRLLHALASASWASAPLRAKIRNADLLQLPTRRALCELLDREDGFVPLAALGRTAKAALGIGLFTTYYHLRRLQQGGHVQVLRSTRRGRIMVAAVSKPLALEQQMVALIGASTAGWAAAYALATLPGGTQKDIITCAGQIMTSEPAQASAVVISRIALFKWIRRLEALGAPGGIPADSVFGPRSAITRKRSGRYWRYYPSQAFQRAVAKHFRTALAPRLVSEGAANSAARFRDSAPGLPPGRAGGDAVIRTNPIDV